jgi:hypothetical protein
VSAPLLLPMGDLVAVAWARTVLGLTDDSVGTTLPPAIDPNTNTPKPWAATGFVTARIVAGGPSIGLAPMRRSVVQFDAYGVGVRVDAEGRATVSGKPLWNRANLLAESLWRACLRYTGHGAPDAPLSLRPEYARATVADATAITEPRRVPGDPGRHARLTLDIALTWAPTDWTP